MVKDEGLPIAYHILAPVKHPLKAALLENAETTIVSPGFLRLLISECQKILNKNNENKFITQQKMVQFTKRLQNQMQNLSKNKKSNVASAVQTTELLDSMCEKLSNEVIEQLLSDEDIIACQKRYNDAFAEYKRKTPKKELTLQEKQSREMLGELVSMIDDIDLDEIDLKQSLLDLLEDCISMIDLHSQRQDVRSQSKLQKNQASRKRFNKLIRQEKNLMEKIEKLSKKHDDATYSAALNDATGQVLHLVEQIKSCKEPVLFKQLLLCYIEASKKLDVLLEERGLKESFYEEFPGLKVSVGVRGK